MDFEPTVLICTDCGEEFVFSAHAQQYFAERGYNRSPRRCKACHFKLQKKQRPGRRRRGSRRNSDKKRMTVVI